MKTDFDIIIIGGGMVGATLALSLKYTQLRIAVVEAYPATDDQQPSFDDRYLAISWGSSRILKAMGLWQGLEARSTFIDKIVVCDKGHFGFHRISAKDRKVDFLGQVISSRNCGQFFWKQLLQQKNVSIFCPAKIEQLNHLDRDSIEVMISQQHTSQSKLLKAKLVVAADGAQSVTRDLAGIKPQRSDYGQAAIIANIETQLPHNGLAIERFTQNGPLALLPLEERLSLVWTVPTAKMDHYLTLSETSFIDELQQQMGQRFGKITKIGRRVGYPLQLLKVEKLYNNRILLIGNAAHGIHPIAGQGFNLGLRDVAWLAEKLIASEVTNEDIGGEKLLADYVKSRQQDIRTIVTLTDSLARLFANQNRLLTFARNTALAAMPFVPMARDWLGETAMGLQGPLPRLACGETLEEINNEAVY